MSLYLSATPTQSPPHADLIDRRSAFPLSGSDSIRFASRPHTHWSNQCDADTCTRARLSVCSHATQSRECDVSRVYALRHRPPTRTAHHTGDHHLLASSARRARTDDDGQVHCELSSRHQSVPIDVQAQRCDNATLRAPAATSTRPRLHARTIQRFTSHRAATYSRQTHIHHLTLRFSSRNCRCHACMGTSAVAGSRSLAWRRRAALPLATVTQVRARTRERHAKTRGGGDKRRGGRAKPSGE